MRALVISVLISAALPALAVDAKASKTAKPAKLEKAAAPAKAARRVEVKVTEKGFEPAEVKLKEGEATTIVFTRVTDNTCITAIDVPDQKIANFALPLNQAAELTITPKKKGTEKFFCSSMAMGDGRLVVE
jgi:plastocyanin domain-containing protein